MARTNAAARLTVVEPLTATHADPSDVQAFAEDLPDRFLHCREMGPNWRPFDVGRHRDGGYERTLRCVRCRTRRIQHLNRDGMLVGSPKLIYPDGYLSHGLGRIDGAGRGVLRLASIARIDASLTAGD
jgi:hypothetical protein